MIECTLEADINQCQYYNRENKRCTNQNKCSFQEEKETQTYQSRYSREERWYEKYYK